MSETVPSPKIRDLQADALTAIRHLIDGNEPHQVVQLNRRQPSGVAVFDGDRAHQAMKTAADLDWLEGEMSEYHSGMSLWTHVHVTVNGMRRALAWPPFGREHTSGRWDDDHWAHWALPCLQRLAAEPTWGQIPASFGMGDITDAHRHWLGLRLLAQAGYVTGRFDSGSVSGVELTLDGRRVIEGPGDALASIHRLLAQGDVTRALIDLVEGVIADFVTDRADQKKVLMNDRTGSPLHKLWQRVDRLGKEKVIDDLDVAILQVAMTARNHVGHTTTDAIVPDAEVVAWVLDGVERVLARP